MRMVIMSLMMLGVGIIGNVISAPPVNIPSRQEQMGVLKNAQEVFEAVKRLVDEEGAANDISVISDVEKVVRRAQEYLAVLEEIALLKIAFVQSENSVHNHTAAKEEVQKTVQEGFGVLDECSSKVSKEMHDSSLKVFDGATTATTHGQQLIDTLKECAAKPGLQQFPCYKNILANDLFPLKLAMMQAISLHKKEHSRTIEIRNFANECVDSTIKSYQEQISNILNNVIFESSE